MALVTFPGRALLFPHIKTRFLKSSASVVGASFVSNPEQIKVFVSNFAERGGFASRGGPSFGGFGEIPDPVRNDLALWQKALEALKKMYQ